MSDVSTEEQGDPASSPRLPDRADMPAGWTIQEYIAFLAFHGRYGPLFMRFAKRSLRSQADAEDAVNATFEALVARWPRVMPMANPSGFAWRVLMNKIQDVRRLRARFTPGDHLTLQGRALGRCRDGSLAGQLEATGEGAWKSQGFVSC
ncbi:sigma-70 family RNA polymerase sigma factor [Streptomyces sp. NPDC032472]|uniref:RNA polymerase sigma factor n=1 Tax=Streptomyces sp. NPDC032472 TaxID=3155018 RepID=UPI0033D14BC9